MRIKSLLLSGAVAVMCVGMFPDAPSAIRSISAAQAQNVSLSFSVFYDGLKNDGEWVRYKDRYVFVPSRVDDNWRPYTQGHWSHTRQYGWVWVSDERFGWATYHYGRWGYARDIGWYWVPGKRWAPAWVSWRRTDRDVSWAPLSPDYDDDYYDRNPGGSVDISASIGALPFYFWVNVPARNFQDRDLNARIVRDQNENRRIYDRSQFAGPVVVENNIIINNVINVNFIQQQSGKPVESVEVKTVNDPVAAKGQQSGQQAAVTVFQGTLKADAEAKPADVKPLEQVTKQQAGKPKLPAATPSVDLPANGEQPAAPAEPTKQPDATKQGETPKTAPPKAEAPKAEPPKAETPPTQPPQAEQPKTEAPKTEPPKTEPPKAQLPKVEPPKAKTPKAEPPKAQAPKAEPPKAEPPKAQAPEAEPPKVEPPKAQAPKADPPKVEPPKVEAPKAEPPKMEPPKAPAPKAEPPKAGKPKASEPCKPDDKSCAPAN
ncbi:DUF6600 domain-containing protein [Aestuariivirga litoralis]|uniref:DUF6600 domain-containing protein n=1 Tax=Aestuariivirga litoralis TaxID=2650924 RepID=UPI0018C719B9|nr:DUF6600 domain-containing protein [Aestuariivirga litoralis]MBG1232082.1 hypothetical protein [Aestuariivirga litoralis]